MKYKDYGTWKFIVHNGQLRRECTNCGHIEKTQPMFCPKCNAYMRKN